MPLPRSVLQAVRSSSPSLPRTRQSSPPFVGVWQDGAKSKKSRADLNSRRPDPFSLPTRNSRVGVTRLRGAMTSKFSVLERKALDAILQEAIIDQELEALGRQVDQTILKRNAARKKKEKALQALLDAKK